MMRLGSKSCAIHTWRKNRSLSLKGWSMGIPFSSRSTLRPWQGAVTDKNLSQGGERAKKYKPRHPGPRGSGELGEDHQRFLPD